MPLIELRNVSKRYPKGVLANEDVDFAVEAGEVHALVGENGAGKSTLMKLLYGLEQPTSGELRLRGEVVRLHGPQDAIRRGIGMVHQNFTLVPEFTIAENLVLGYEPQRSGVLDRRQAIEATRQLSQQYGLHVEPTARVDSVPVGMRQRVEILKTLYRGAEILILDEPTAVLTPQETTDLFRAIRRLVERGKTVIFITHKLREVKAITERVTVMRRGRVVGTLPTAQASESELAHMMVGRTMLPQLNRVPVQRGPVVLHVDNLGYINENGVPVLRGVTLDVHAGEIVGVAGVEGNGQTELVEVLTGLRAPTSGTITLDGTPIGGTSRAIRHSGVAHIPEDRLRNGAALDASVAENLIVDRFYAPPFTLRGWLRPAVVRENARALIERFDIRVPNGEVPIGQLSGGNIQKTVVARELSRAPRLLVAAQPTRGVDIGAIEFIHGQLLHQREAGMAILLVSADLAEVRALSDRLAVMHNGQVAAVFDDPRGTDEEEIGRAMLGVAN